jgi:hypothetical protein
MLRMRFDMQWRQAGARAMAPAVAECARTTRM